MADDAVARAGGATRRLPAVSDAEGTGPVEGRGRTAIADRVLERLAARMALDVPGVVRHSTGLDLGPLGVTYPSASAESSFITNRRNRHPARPRSGWSRARSQRQPLQGLARLRRRQGSAW